MSEGTDGKTSGARRETGIPTEFPTEAFSVVGIRRVLCADLDERAFACVYKFGERAFAFGSL